MPIGSVEIDLPAGGDFSQQSNGDLVLVQDTPLGAAATTQRIIRLILTNARIVYPDGTASPPDDKVNTTWGSSARARIGQPLTNALIGGLQSDVLSAINADPAITQIPAPTVNVTRAPQFGPFAVLLDVRCETVTGEIITIPSLSLTLGA